MGPKAYLLSEQILMMALFVFFLSTFLWPLVFRHASHNCLYFRALHS